MILPNQMIEKLFRGIIRLPDFFLEFLTNPLKEVIERAHPFILSPPRVCRCCGYVQTGWIGVAGIRIGCNTRGEQRGAECEIQQERCHTSDCPLTEEDMANDRFRLWCETLASGITAIPLYAIHGDSWGRFRRAIRKEGLLIRGFPCVETYLFSAPDPPKNTVCVCQFFSYSKKEGATHTSSSVRQKGLSRALFYSVHLINNNWRSLSLVAFKMLRRLFSKKWRDRDAREFLAYRQWLYTHYQFNPLTQRFELLAET